MRKLLLCTIVICGLYFLTAAPAVWAGTILFVPADDRPVSLEYAVDTLNSAHFTALIPPAEYLASRGRSGDPENLWLWLKDNAYKADAMVLSADTLIYGGLVDSRTHNFSSDLLMWRLRNFHQLRQLHPNIPIYVFSTIMRSPHGSAGGVEPSYYEKYGPDIFQLTALRDKAETVGLRADEQGILRTLEATVPREYVDDWLARRQRNYQVNARLIELTKTGVINYLIIGRDDTSPYSQSHRESRLLGKLAADLSGKYSSFPGADQLGMILLARAYNVLTLQKPVIRVEYALGAGAGTVASYEDQPIGRTITEHITAAGGIVAGNSQTPDLVLAVNTPLDNGTPEAGVFENFAMSSEATRQFVDGIEKRLAQKIPVVVVDIAFANGADNTLMKELYERGLLNKLSAYSGWNTASNSLGYAVGQGIMARGMSDKERQRLLAIRYLDDWAYQANIRKELYREEFDSDLGRPEYLRGLEPEITAHAQQKIRLFAGRYLWIEPNTIQISFPWHRLFEIDVQLADRGQKKQGN